MHEQSTAHLQYDAALQEQTQLNAALTALTHWVTKPTPTGVEEALNAFVDELFQDHDPRLLLKASQTLDFSEQKHLLPRWLELKYEILVRTLYPEPTVSGIRDKGAVPIATPIDLGASEDILSHPVTPEERKEWDALRAFIIACEQSMFLRPTSLDDRRRILLHLWQIAKKPKKAWALITQASFVAPIPLNDLVHLPLVEALKLIDPDVFVDALELLADETPDHQEGQHTLPADEFIAS